ncbi:MAG: hypothetical protein QM820_39515 [Minicystis sp.]
MRDTQLRSISTPRRERRAHRRAILDPLPVRGLIHPLRKTLEVFALEPDGRWKLLDVHQGAKRVRVEPFAALKLDLALLWPEDEAEDEEEEVDGPVIHHLPRAIARVPRPQSS